MGEFGTTREPFPLRVALWFCGHLFGVYRRFSEDRREEARALRLVIWSLLAVGTVLVVTVAMEGRAGQVAAAVIFVALAEAAGRLHRELVRTEGP